MKRSIIVVLFLLVLTGCSDTRYKNGEINVLNWSSYIPNNVINDFEKEYDIKVNYGTYSSNEELLAKITNSKSGTYDLVFPSDYMVELMVEKGLLEHIDKSKLFNYDNIDDIYLKQVYDLDNSYSLPFLMTYIVMVVDRGEISDNIYNYNNLLDDDYFNDIVMLDDGRIIIGLALNSLGYDINSLNDENYDEVKSFLLKLKRNIKAFDSDSPKSFLITDEVDLGVMWHAEAILTKKYNDNIEIITPNNGYVISMDNYCILKGSKNLENTYKFIDYLLRIDINKRIVDSYPYVSSVGINNALDDRQITSILNNGSYLKNIGYNIRYYDELWAEIK